MGTQQHIIVIGSCFAGLSAACVPAIISGLVAAAEAIAYLNAHG